MEYGAKIYREDGSWLAEFPDCPGCQTFGDTKEHAVQMAEEALEGWLEANLIRGQVPPRPRRHANTTPIVVRPQLAMILQVRWLRNEKGLTQAQLAKAAGIQQQQVARFENPMSNPTFGTVIALVEALHATLTVGIKAEPESKPLVSRTRPKPRARPIL